MTTRYSFHGIRPPVRVPVDASDAMESARNAALLLASGRFADAKKYAERLVVDLQLLVDKVERLTAEEDEMERGTR